MNLLSNSYFKFSLAIVGAAIVCVAACYIAVIINASGRTVDSIEDVPATEYTLLLGTSPITPQGAHNYYFDNRIKCIKCTVELYQNHCLDEKTFKIFSYLSRLSAEATIDTTWSSG